MVKWLNCINKENKGTCTNKKLIILCTYTINDYILHYKSFLPIIKVPTTPCDVDRPYSFKIINIITIIPTNYNHILRY